jgi:hypothetical protein
MHKNRTTITPQKMKMSNDHRRSRKRHKRSTYARTEKNREGYDIRLTTLVDMSVNADDLFL